MHFRTLCAVAAAALPFVSADAQTKLPRPEIGVRGGFIRLNQDTPFGDQTSSAFVFPLNPLFFGSGFHLAFFVSPRVAIEPQLGFIRISDEGSSPFSISALGLQGNFFMAPDATRSPYLFAVLGQLSQSNGGEDLTSVGGGIGFRKVAREALALRYELRYRRWRGDAITTGEFGVLIGVGAVIR